VLNQSDLAPYLMALDVLMADSDPAIARELITRLDVLTEAYGLTPGTIGGELCQIAKDRIRQRLSDT
jgi:hypothetical protein